MLSFMLRPLCTSVRAPGSYRRPSYIGPEAGQAEILPVPGIEHRHFRGPFAAVTYVRSWKESAACRIARQVQVVLLQMATASGKECD